MGRNVLLVLLAVLAASTAVLMSGCGSVAGVKRVPGGTPQPLPHFDHIVIVVEENHGYDEVTRAADAPYIAALRQQGAVFSDAHAVSHPSQPNYLALFAGSTFGLISDACPQQFSGPNLGEALLARGLRFTGYSENLPQAGYTGCDDGASADLLYARKHNPWVDFAGVPMQSNQPFSSFPTAFDQLPTVAFVVPNQAHDMHSGSVATADAWLRQNLGRYAEWASAHNSLLIVTWDEDDGSEANHILTLFVGAHVAPGTYAETVTHYDVLRTVEALESVPFTNDAANATTIADVWRS